MNKKFQRLVIAGATGGIGQAIAIALDQEGYTLLLSSRSGEKLNSLEKQLKGQGHQCVVADLTSPCGIKTLEDASTNFSACGVINCFGVSELATLCDIPGGDIANMLETNLLAPINVCKSMLPQLLSQSEAVIINVGSILGSIGYAGSSIYCASKFGLRGFTEALRRELSDSNVRVIYLAPRATNTTLNTNAINQMNRELGNAVDEPSQVAQHVLTMLKKGKSVNHFLGWPECFFVKLNSVFPTLVDKALMRQLTTIKRYCQGKNPTI